MTRRELKKMIREEWESHVTRDIDLLHTPLPEDREVILAKALLRYNIYLKDIPEQVVKGIFDAMDDYRNQ